MSSGRDGTAGRRVLEEDVRRCEINTKHYDVNRDEAAPNNLQPLFRRRTPPWPLKICLDVTTGVNSGRQLVHRERVGMLLRVAGKHFNGY